MEAQYGIVDVDIEQFIVSNFNKFIMVDGKLISNQIHEFQELQRGVEKKKKKKKAHTTFSEDFKVSCLIDKLSPSWSNFAQSVKHKQGEFAL